MINPSSIFLSVGTSPSFDPALVNTMTASSPGVSNLLNVTFLSGGGTVPILPGQTVTGESMPFGAQVLPYGTNGASGTGNLGTYALSVISDPIPSETMQITLSQFGQAGPGSLFYDWNQHNLYNRNTANNGWNLIGSSELPNFGLLPRSGGTLSSAMTGSNGLLTADGNTPFTAPPYVTSKLSRAATLADIDNIESSLVSQINTQVNASIQQIGVPGIRSSMAFGFGQIGLQGGTTLVYYSIPVTGMTYPDGTVVNASDCYGFASIATWHYFGSGIEEMTYCQPQAGSNGMSWAAYSQFMGGGAIYSYLMNYMVIAIKPTA